eukprot:497748-Rhodomonas_salina.2
MAGALPITVDTSAGIGSVVVSTVASGVAGGAAVELRSVTVLVDTAWVGEAAGNTCVPEKGELVSAKVEFAADVSSSDVVMKATIVVGSACEDTSSSFDEELTVVPENAADVSIGALCAAVKEVVAVVSRGVLDDLRPWIVVELCWGMVLAAVSAAAVVTSGTDGVVVITDSLRENVPVVAGLAISVVVDDRLSSVCSVVGLDDTANVEDAVDVPSGVLSIAVRGVLVGLWIGAIVELVRGVALAAVSAEAAVMSHSGGFVVERNSLWGEVPVDAGPSIYAEVEDTSFFVVTDCIMVRLDDTVESECAADVSTDALSTTVARVVAAVSRGVCLTTSVERMLTMAVDASAELSSVAVSIAVSGGAGSADVV